MKYLEIAWYVVTGGLVLGLIVGAIMGRLDEWYNYYMMAAVVSIVLGVLTGHLEFGAKHLNK